MDCEIMYNLTIIVVYTLILYKNQSLMVHDLFHINFLVSSYLKFSELFTVRSSKRMPISAMLIRILLILIPLALDFYLQTLTEPIWISVSKKRGHKDMLYALSFMLWLMILKLNSTEYALNSLSICGLTKLKRISI